MYQLINLIPLKSNRI